MRRLLIIIGLCSLLSEAATAQPYIDTTTPLRIALSNSEGRIIPTLKYDFSVQYPYYEVSSADVSGKPIQLKISNTGSKGYVYLFSINHNDSVQLFETVDCSTIKDVTIVVDNIFSTGAISIWYATVDSIASFNSLVSGIELTNGPLLRRIIMQTGKSLYLPCEDWHFAGNGDIALQLTQLRLRNNSSNSIIPIVIQVTKSGKDIPLASENRQKTTHKRTKRSK